MSKKESQKTSQNKSLSVTTYIFFVVGIVLIIVSIVLGGLAKNPKDSLNTEKIDESAKVEQEPEKVEEQISTLPVDSTFTSKSYILYDVSAEKIVGGLDIDKKVANASTTKIMTALVALEKYPLNKILTVPESCVGLEGNNVGFLPGEQYFVQDLMYGLLLRSASDAACTFTNNYDGDFISEMNKKASNLGLTNTNYVNAIGLDAPDHYSSSRDLLKLILAARKNETLKIIMGTRYFTLTEAKTKRQYTVENTNRLLFEIPGAVGYKTGFTSNAGECLVFGYTNFGTELIIVVMGSSDRFADAKKLLDLYLLKLGNPSPEIIEKPSPTPTPIATVTPNPTSVVTPNAPIGAYR